jgi:hypothetical protein
MGAKPWGALLGEFVNGEWMTRRVRAGTNFINIYSLLSSPLLLIDLVWLFGLRWLFYGVYRQTYTYILNGGNFSFGGKPPQNSPLPNVVGIFPGR